MALIYITQINLDVLSQSDRCRQSAAVLFYCPRKTGFRMAHDYSTLQDLIIGRSTSRQPVNLSDRYRPVERLDQNI